MSQSALLVRYRSDGAGRLYESDDEALIDTAFISPELIDFMKRDGLLETRLLYEDQECTSATEITCISEPGYDGVLSELERVLLRFLDSEIVIRFKDLQGDTDRDSIMEKMRTISNLYYLVKLKKESFSNSPNAVIMVG